MKKILVFGDSIAWGEFDDERGGWVERLKTKFIKEFTDEDTGLSVHNLSVSSNNTRGVLGSIENDIKKFDLIEPEEYIFLFSIGINDAVYYGSADNAETPLKEFKDNLKRIIDISRKHSTEIFFTGLLGVDENQTMPRVDDLYWENRVIKNYDEAIREICEEKGIIFIPFWDVLEKADMSDGLHPNAVGHEKIFRRVSGYFENA